MIDIFPAVPGERWSILNFFDTNPGVIKILIEEYKKENRNESTDDFKSWIKENGKKLFDESSDILKKLIKTNIRSFDSGSKTEDTFMRLVKQKFGLEDKDVVRYCLGSIKDRVDSIDFSIYNNLPVILKGCSKKEVPQEIYVLATQKLIPFAKSIMFGEACSAVPLFKRK